MKPPFSYFGGKQAMAPTITAHFPDHSHYVEVFGGSGAILFAKKRASFEVFNDINGDIVNFFRVIRDRGPEFMEKVTLIPYSRAEFLSMRDDLASGIDDEIRRAVAFYVVARQCFGAKMDKKPAWGFGVREISRGMPGTVSAWLSGIYQLPKIISRLEAVQIEYNDFRKILATYNTPEYLAYLDPPYIPDTRKAGSYTNELTESDHGDLVEILLEYPGSAILSGYDHPAYSPLMESGWKRIGKEIQCAAAGRTRASSLQGRGSAGHQVRTECLWMNPKCVEKKGFGGLFE